MGLFIHLYLNPKGISPEEWERVYQESLTLLRSFPAPLIRLKREEIGSKKRFVYTSDVICDAGTQDEHWMVIGDLVSLQHAEDFRLYRYPETQFKHGGKGNDLDVLWADADSLNYVDGNGINLFGNKTQGYPYHLAILAVAILFEIRFPEKCYLLGDIEGTQVEQMSRWISSILGTPEFKPVCLDTERLYQRLSRLYDNPRYAVKRFKTLFRGSDEEQFEALLRYADQTTILEIFIEDLNHYTSLSQHGAICKISQFLMVTRDIRQLIDIVLRAEAAREKKSEDFNLGAILKVLCSHYLTIAYQEREPLEVFAHTQDELMTIEDTFAHIFMTLTAVPSAIDFYIDSAELLEIFCSYQPEKQAIFQEIIHTYEQRCREELEKTKTLISEMERKVQEAAQKKEGKSLEQAMVKATPVGGFEGKRMSEEEAYIMKQVVLQTERFKDGEKSAGLIGAQLQGVITKHPNLFSFEERSYYLEGIYEASFENGFALRESAWKTIDREENIDILKHLFAFALIKEREINFWRWRINIFESPHLWKHLIKEPDKDMIADDDAPKEL